MSTLDRVTLFPYDFESGQSFNQLDSGVFGASIPSSGANGPSVLDNDTGIGATDFARAYLRTPAPDLLLYEDGSGVYAGTVPDTATYALYINGAFDSTATINLGLVGSPPDTPTATPMAVGTTSAICIGSPYSDPDGDPHESSQFQCRLASDPDWTTPVEDTGEVPAAVMHTFLGLTPGTDYLMRLRYKDDTGLWSAYSADAAFTTVDVHQGSGAPQASRATGVGSGTVTTPAIIGAGAPQAQRATASGSGLVVRWGTGAVAAERASAAGAGIIRVLRVGSGDPAALRATAVGTGVIKGFHKATGSPQASRATAMGIGTIPVEGTHTGFGMVQAQRATASGTGTGPTNVTQVDPKNIAQQWTGQ